MGLLDDIKSTQEQNNIVEAQKEEKQLEYEKQIISDESASLIADRISQTIINKIKEVVPKREKIFINRWEPGLLDCLFKEGLLNEHYRYEIPFVNSNTYNKSFLCQKGNLDYAYCVSNNLLPNIFPNDNGFMYFTCLHWNNTEGIYYRNLESVKKVFRLAQIKLQKEGINCVYEIKTAIGGEELSFYAIIPCDKDGNI